MADAQGILAMNLMNHLAMTEGIEMVGAIGEEALLTKRVMAGVRREETRHLRHQSSKIFFSL